MSICMEQADCWQGGGQGEPDPCGEAVELMWSEVGARRGHRGPASRLRERTRQSSPGPWFCGAFQEERSLFSS